MKPRKAIIMGAAGRDYHNFLVRFRDDPSFRVVAFTANQIPGISGKVFPKELSGKLYPNGIPIHHESELPSLVKKHSIGLVILSYSDLSYPNVMHKASLVNSLGPDFMLMGTSDTMLRSRKSIIAVTAVRTGCGKSQTTRKAASILRRLGRKVAVVRHPMPYGNLNLQACQRYETLSDLDRHECTIEEREEYEPLIEESDLLFSGVDYREILRQAEKEADVIIWDGGNNDTPFFRPDLHVTVVDPHRPGHEIAYYPGETNLRMSDVVVVNKEDTATRSGIQEVMRNIKAYNPRATIIHAKSRILLENPSLIRGKRVLVVEDGPTTTHGGMPYGAGMIAARRYSAKPVDPRPYATGSIKKVFRDFPHLSGVLPAMGYSKKQLSELRQTINKTKCDAVISGTPTDFTRSISVNKPVLRARYNLEEKGNPDLEQILRNFIKKHR